MQSVSIDGKYVHSGAGNMRQIIAVTTAQHSMKDTDTKADNFSDIVKLTPRIIRQRAKAPVKTPNPKICPNAIEIVPAARALCCGTRVAKCWWATPSYRPTAQRLMKVRAIAAAQAPR